jgi:hypothetical protein
MGLARILGDTAAAIANLHPAHRPHYEALVTADTPAEPGCRDDEMPPLARRDGGRRHRGDGVSRPSRR